MATRKLKPTPHFFKPLLPGFHLQLVIPEPFYVKYMEDKKAEKAVLRTPRGKFWRVKLNGRVIEDDNWEEFCKDEKLEVGHFLVFGLVEAGNVVGLVFEVLVFDQTTCLRDCSFIKEETQPESAGHLKNKKQIEEQSSEPVPQHPYFVLDLSYYAANSATLFVPVKFARENGLCNRFCDIILVNEQGKEWLAALRFKVNNSQQQVYINGSWSAFRCANSLKAGDSCLFQVIRNGNKPVMKITRLRPKTKKQPTNKAGDEQQFFVTVKPYYMKHYLLRIPAMLAKKSGLKRKLPEEMIIRNERGKSWTVIPRSSKSGNFHLGLGWTAFARSNGIQVGDVLKLELIKKGIKPVLKISGVKRASCNKKINQKNRLETQEDVKPTAKF